MADYFDKSRHHLSVTDVSTADVLGYVLARKNGQLAYAEFDGKALVDLFSSDAPTQVNTDPERKLILGQSTHHAGFGKEYYDSGDPKRYFASTGMDLSNENNGMLSWTATAIALTSYAAVTITNADFETVTSGWTLGFRSNNFAHAGTYSYSVENADSTMYQDISWNNKYQSCVFTFSCWIYATAGSNGRISINDGVGTTNSSYHTGVAGWENLTVTRQLSASATRLRIGIYRAAGAGAVYADDASFTQEPISAKCVRGATFNDAEYIGYGNIVAKLNGTGDGFTIVYNFDTSDVISDIVPFQVSATDYLFFFLGTSVPYRYMTTAEAFTESTATNKTYQFAAWVNTTADTMYANDGTNTVRSTTNPLNGGVAWSAQIVVGAAADAITHLQEKDGALLIDKEDMPYYLNSSSNVQKDLAPECASGKATHSGKNSTLWQGVYYRPTGDQALLSSGTTNEWIQPAKFTANNSQFAGQVEAVAGDEEWLYCATDNSTKVEILKGRSETIDGVTAWRWHPYQQITLTGVETMWVSTVYQKRLWISSTTASESLYYIPLPTKYGDLTADSNRSFLTGGTFETPWLHGGFPNDNKLAQSLDVTMGHAYDADIYFNVNYKELGDSSWSSTTYKFDGSATSMTETQYISTSSTSVVSPMFKLRFTGVTDDTNKTPILLNYKLNTLLYPATGKLIYCTVRVGDGVTDLAGLSMSNKTVLQKTCLDNARTTTSLVSFTDIDGTSRTGKFLPLPSSTPRRVPVKDEKGRTIEYEYNLLILVVDTS